MDQGNAHSPAAIVNSVDEDAREVAAALVKRGRGRPRADPRLLTHMHDMGLTGCAQPIKKIRPRHKIVVALHLEGYSIKDISERTGYSYSWIYNLLNDPTIKEFMRHIQEGYDLELQALRGIAINAVRRGLKHGDVDVALKAVNAYVKLPGVAEPPVTNNVTINTDMRVNILNKLRVLVEESHAAPGAPTSSAQDVVDASAVDVTEAEAGGVSPELPSPGTSGPEPGLPVHREKGTVPASD